jgi:hypothetical protein
MAVLVCLAPFAGSANAELLYATNGSSIARFDSGLLSAVTTVAVTGLQAGETLVGIDVRPQNNLLYGVGSTSRVYTINPLLGTASQVGAAGQLGLSGTAFGVDFNPVPDRLRVVGNTGQNLRLNPTDGTRTATDTILNPAGNFVAAAYASNFPGAVSTTLYVIDSAAGTLGIVSAPNEGGPIIPLGSLGLGTDLNENIGFDISGVSGVGFATITVGGQSRLYTIHLSTGLATHLGPIGTGTTPFLGVTAAVAPEPAGLATLATVAAARRCARRRRPRRPTLR